jgi:hypothetical protein
VILSTVLEDFGEPRTRELPRNPKGRSSEKIYSTHSGE